MHGFIVAAILFPGVAVAAAPRASVARDACPPVPISVTGDGPTAELLRGISQRLLDAVGAGDTAVWSRHLDDQGVFVDEEGNVRDKRGLLAEIRPLPAGISGRICVTAPRATVLGEIAVLTYDALETATVHGQELQTRYHTTDTYVRRGTEWRLLGSHAAVLPSEHTPVAVRPETLNDFVGDYVLAAGVEYRVNREGDRLFGTRTGGRPEELLPLGGDRFFRVGARRGERIFRRDSAGRVDAMLDRRDNNDLVWKRALPGARPLTYEEFRAAGRRAPYLLRLTAEKGGLTYYGVRHTSDPDDTQIAEIERLWREVRPTLAFNEGGDPPVAKTREAAVRSAGEPGFVRFLAARDSVPVRSLEPDRKAEVAELLRQFTEEHVKLFYVLRQIPQVSQRTLAQPVETLVEDVLRQMTRATGLAGAPASATAVRASCGRLLPGLSDCFAITGDWFDPSLPAPKGFTNLASRTTGEFRDRHMIEVLTRAVQSGERVFAVAGIGHVVMQEPVLRAAIPGR